jgi:hypothetical protein
MWVISFLIIGPIIYKIVSVIVDYVSGKAQKVNKKYGKEEIIYVTTYQHDNITEDDIMRFFKTQIDKYTQKYFIVNSAIYNNNEEQNYAWSVKTTKETYRWGIVYTIQFHFSNGWVCINFSNSGFSSGGQPAKDYYLFRYYGCMVIENELDYCWEEARIKWKMNGIEPKNDLPFNFYSLAAHLTGKQIKYDWYEASNKYSSTENYSGADLLSFYRSLLGLRHNFSQAELKDAYRKAVGRYHPDRYGSSSPRDRENAEILMKQINEAYERLKNR